MTYPVRSHSGLISRVTTNCEKSAEVIVAEIIFVKDRTIQSVKLKCMSR